MAKVITFGELMLRLQPYDHLRFVQCNEFQASYGGGEANVAVSLVNYGMDAAFVTKLPSHEMGQGAVNSLRRYGVSTNKILRGGDRLGLYYIEKGASQRPSKVIYDRAGSAIALAKPEEFDWDKIFDGAEWFHFSGVTPALGGHLPEICMMACKAAKEKGIRVSCDLNYRKNMWSKEEAKTVMTKLSGYIDICIGNEEDANDVFGIAAPDTDISSGTLSNEGYEYVAKKLCEEYGFKMAAITLRGSISASDNTWGAMVYDGFEYYFSKRYSIRIIDRVGGGDSFAAGLIYGLASGYSNREAMDFAVAASCLKQTIEGDFNMASLEEVERLVKGDGSGRVQR